MKLFANWTAHNWYILHNWHISALWTIRLPLHRRCYTYSIVKMCPMIVGTRSISDNNNIIT